MCNLLRQILCKKEVPSPKPILRRTIKANELWNIIRDKFPIGDIELSDMEYSLCDIEDIEAFLDVDETNHYKYVTEKYDCDKFARRLWGQFSTPEWGQFAIGLLWTEKHALLVCVDTNEDIWFLEPQTDERRSDLLDWQGTEMRFVVL